MSETTEYRIVCSDVNHQCGDIYKRIDTLALDFDFLTKGHDDNHGHTIQARLVGPWEPVDPELIDRALDIENER